MKTRTFLLALAVVLALAPALLAQGRPGSIYDPDRGPNGMMEDKTARRPGDLITVLIAENQDVRNEESANLRKQTTLNYALDSFNIKPTLFDPLPDIEANSQDDFTGTANYQKRGNFTARLTAMVMDVLPNGNLVLSGRREIRIDYETKVIEFSGVIRRYDLAPDNTIQSSQVAEARIAYIGQGVLTDSTNRKGLGRILHGLIAWLWPF
jgi:flagellar L-ring protein precursor FlgH